MYGPNINTHDPRVIKSGLAEIYSPFSYKLKPRIVKDLKTGRGSEIWNSSLYNTWKESNDFHVSTILFS